MKYIKKRYILFVFLFLSLLFLYLTKDIRYPKSIKQTVSLYSLDGNHINVDFDITFHEYLLYEPRLSGTIHMGDTKYFRVREHEPSIGRTMSTQPFMMWDTSPKKMISNMILVAHITEDMNEIYMVVNENESSMMYYGPAETVEEAQQIFENLFKE